MRSFRCPRRLGNLLLPSCLPCLVWLQPSLSVSAITTITGSHADSGALAVVPLRARATQASSMPLPSPLPCVCLFFFSRGCNCAGPSRTSAVPPAAIQLSLPSGVGLPSIPSSVLRGSLHYLPPLLFVLPRGVRPLKGLQNCVAFVCQQS